MKLIVVLSLVLLLHISSTSAWWWSKSKDKGHQGGGYGHDDGYGHSSGYGHDQGGYGHGGKGKSVYKSHDDTKGWWKCIFCKTKYREDDKKQGGYGHDDHHGGYGHDDHHGGYHRKNDHIIGSSVSFGPVDEGFGRFGGYGDYEPKKYSSSYHQFGNGYNDGDPYGYRRRRRMFVPFYG